MKKIINYYYNLYPNKIYKNKEGYYFFLRDIKFCLKEYNRSEESLSSLVEISNTLYNMGIKVNTFIINKNKQYITEFDKKKYALFKINDYEKCEISLKEIINFSKLISKNYEKLEIDMLENWEKRVDLLERQMIEYNKEYPLIKRSLNYYIGLAENAISYVHDALSEKGNTGYVLSHNRFTGQPCLQSIYDPLSYIFDFISRDIAFYIKINFFNNINVLDELEEIIRNKEINSFECKILFSRILYPDYYFDAIEKIIQNRDNEKKLIKIIAKHNLYENLICEVYEIIKKYVNLQQIEWTNINE